LNSALCDEILQGNGELSRVFRQADIGGQAIDRDSSAVESMSLEQRK
jgi:hypothetical protein